MFDVSQRTLKILAALVWYAGGGALLLKSAGLLASAESMAPGRFWPWGVGLGGLVLGGVKARWLFGRSCRRNLARIEALTRPKAWQFFRPRFFFFLGIMIAAGMLLSRLAAESYAFLLAVATLDLSIATALVVSGRVFWQRSPSVQGPND